LEQFGDVYVFDLYEIPPNKKSVKKVVGVLNRKNLVVFVALLSAIVGVWMAFEKKKEEQARARVVRTTPPPSLQVPQAPTYIPCRTNLPSFAKLFDYSDQVRNGRLLKSIGEKTVEMSFELIEIKPVEEVKIVLPAGLDEKEFNMQDMGAKTVFSISGYDNCLMFIDSNKALPLVVEELTMQNCRLSLEKSCIGG
jgi:hypothetical protein